MAQCATGFSEVLQHTMLEKVKLFVVCSITAQSMVINKTKQLYLFVVLS